MTAQPPTAGAVNRLQETKLRISALSPAELSMLKDLYQYNEVRPKVSGTGRVNVFLGALTILFGLSHTRFDIFALIQTLIGCLIVVVSLWAVIAPSVRLLLLNSIMFAVCGVWNVLIPIRLGLSTFPLIWAVFGFIQLYWARQFYRHYKDSLQNPLARPTPEALRLYNQLWSAITVSTSRDDIDYIELKMRGGLWRGLLLPNVATFAADRRQMLIVADRSSISFTPNDSRIIPGSDAREYHGKLAVDSTTSPAVFPRLSLERFTRWKASQST
jgi:hypothetical protein